VKTSGFEPQYGQATGGLVQLVTKSGSTHYHGELGAYFAPYSLQATWLQSDTVRTNKAGLFNGRGNYDIDGQIGGNIPGNYFKDHVFFFGSFNPTWNQQYVQAPPTAGLAALGQMKLQTNVYNWAGKLTWSINGSNQVEVSGFGDPSHTTTGE